MTQPFKEALKELMRVILLSVIPVLITSVEAGIVDPKVVLTVAILAALRFIDKYLHENAPEGKAGGLTRF